MAGIKLGGDAGAGRADCRRISIAASQVLNTDQAGISGYAGSENILLTGTTCSNNAGGGIDLKTGPLNDEWGTECKGWRIQDCVSTFNAYGLIFAKGSGGPTSKVPNEVDCYNSVFDNNTVHGMFVSVGERVWFDGCQANNNAQVGLQIGAAAAFTVNWANQTAVGNGVANINDNR